jgi:hypothetical protein
MGGPGQAGQAAGPGGAGGGQGADGNAKLEQAFDHAMQQAQETLSITTVKGASLYALKQRPQ